MPVTFGTTEPSTAVCLSKSAVGVGACLCGSTGTCLCVMSDSSDDDLSGFISPSSIRPSMRRDVGMGSARQTSTIVKAAARRQLRGDSDKKPVKEVAADIRRRMNESASPGKSSEHSPPPSSSMIMSAPVTPFQDNVSAGSAASPAAVGVPLRQVVVRRRGMGTAPANGLVGIGIKFTVDAGEHKVTSLLPEVRVESVFPPCPSEGCFMEHLRSETCTTWLTCAHAGPCGYDTAGVSGRQVDRGGWSTTVWQDLRRSD